MSLSVEEAKTILAPILASYDDWLAKGEIDKVVSLYAPDGVLIQRGISCAYGRDNIREALKPFAIPTDSTITEEKYEATSDHIIFRAVFSSKVKATGSVFGGKFQTIYRKEGRQWLIIYDEFQA